jgi:hypothetical protein
VTVSNATVVQPNGSSPRNTVEIHSSRAHPAYRNLHSEKSDIATTFQHLSAYAPIDIAYVKLSKDALEQVFPKIRLTDDPSIEIGSAHPIAILVGYGSDRYIPGNPENASGSGKKRIGHHSIDFAHSNYYLLHEKTENYLRGDSGGPLLLEEEGGDFLLGHAHKILPGIGIETYVTKRGKKKTRKVLSYYASVVTAYSKANLCWVERESGIDLPNVDCSGKE